MKNKAERKGFPPLNSLMCFTLHSSAFIPDSPRSIDQLFINA